jgi:hypothetical protein
MTAAFSKFTPLTKFTPHAFLCRLNARIANDARQVLLDHGESSLHAHAARVGAGRGFAAFELCLGSAFVLR